jgi:hypothetical protein
LLGYPSILVPRKPLVRCPLQWHLEIQIQRGLIVCFPTLPQGGIGLSLNRSLAARFRENFPTLDGRQSSFCPFYVPTRPLFSGSFLRRGIPPLHSFRIPSFSQSMCPLYRRYEHAVTEIPLHFRRYVTPFYQYGARFSSVFPPVGVVLCLRECQWGPSNSPASNISTEDSLHNLHAVPALSF